jgi:type IV pilus assembly protein PilE
MNQQKGFSLIELMIVVVIIGILAAIAIPNYRDYVTRGRIPDATSNLASKRIQMEQWYQDNRDYSTAPICAAADSTTSQYFTFTCDNLSATTYTLTATGQGSMANFTYTVTEGNAKNSTITEPGWTGSANCWASKKDGSC